MRSQRGQRVSARLTVLGSGAVVFVAAAGLLGAHAAAAARPAGPAGRVLTPAKAPKPVPAPSLPTQGPGIYPTSSSLSGIVAVARGTGEVLDGKALSAVVLPQLSLYVYPIAQSIPDPAFPEDGNKLVNFAWILSNPPSATQPVLDHLSFGTIPTFSLTTLAFGSIPVTAKVDLTQPVGSGGVIEPFVVDLAAEPPAVQNGGVTLSGVLDVRLSDVTVDGRPVSLGSSCRTVTPSTLTAYAVKGLTPPDYYPLFGGTLAGSIKIPAFQGCYAALGPGGAEEDISSLFSGTVSGSVNTAFVGQGGVGGLSASKAYACEPNSDIGGTMPCTSPSPLPTITASISPSPSPTDFNYDPPRYR